MGKKSKFKIRSKAQLSFVEYADQSLGASIKTSVQLPSDNSLEFTVHHSQHSWVRASQRSIDHNLISYVLLLGTPFQKQGMTFFTILDKDRTGYLSHRIAEKVKNLVVVLGTKSKWIVTCYYSKNAVRHLKRKGKELM